MENCDTGLDLFERSGFRRDNMLADKDFHPETRNLTPETKYDSHSSKNLTKSEANLKPET